ncbi:hypothetical protein F2Q70_00004998 [Brassica cretica]|uniref:Uncharacterized protein n=1 Tax=Brassica cretica TaxID=69181 RepID=A0A8S9IRZ3_BRACR|nr:hypothetical protein F2Q70_00004998 [Brassica cretica]
MKFSRHFEALSDGVRCGLSLAAFELGLCGVELAIVCSSCTSEMWNIEAKTQGEFSRGGFIKEICEDCSCRRQCASSRSPKSLVRSWMMRTKTGSGSITTLMKMVWWDFFLGLEGPDLRVGHSEALSDGVRCGLSLAAFELALCVVELAIVLLPRCGRLKPRLRGSLAEMVSLKRSMKIAAVEDSVLHLEKVGKETVGTQNIPGLENNNDIVAKLTANHLGSVLAKMVFQTTIYHIWRELVLIVIIQSGQRLISLHE